MEAMVDEAIRHVDLTKHEGEHPRLGAVDVIPFVPIRGAMPASPRARAQRIPSLAKAASRGHRMPQANRSAARKTSSAC